MIVDGVLTYIIIIDVRIINERQAAGSKEEEV